MIPAPSAWGLLSWGQDRSDRGCGGATPPDNRSRAISGRFPVDFQVNAGNSQGIKK